MRMYWQMVHPRKLQELKTWQIILSLLFRTIASRQRFKKNREQLNSVKNAELCCPLSSYLQKKEKAFSSTAGVIATAYHRFPSSSSSTSSFHQIDRLYKMSDRPKRFKSGHLSNLSIWLKPIKMKEEEEKEGGVG